MNAEAPLPASQAVPAGRVRKAQQDPAWVRWSLTGLAVGVVGVLVVIPVVNIFVEALSEGVGAYWANLFDDPDTRHAMLLTLTVVPFALAANLVFGIAAAWAIARFEFRGRTLLTSLIDLPFAVSPVVAGLMFVLIFGLQGYLGPFLRRDGYTVMPYLTSLVAVVLFVARELIPIMEAVGADEELAALTLGANGWQMFWTVTVPNIKWGLVYGLILCNARAVGEFGAVYVVSGHITGQTDTMPLRIEKLFQEYNLPGSFAVASLLTLLAVLTLLIKARLERKGSFR